MKNVTFEKIEPSDAPRWYPVNNTYLAVRTSAYNIVLDPDGYRVKFCDARKPMGPFATIDDAFSALAMDARARAAVELIGPMRAWNWFLILGIPTTWALIVGAIWLIGGAPGLQLLAVAAVASLVGLLLFGVASSLRRTFRGLSREARGGILTGLALLAMAGCLAYLFVLEWPPAGWGR